MKQLRLSIPFVGGVTAIYEQEEVAAMKQRVHNKLNKVGRGFKVAGIVCLVLAEPVIKGAAKMVDNVAAKVQKHEAASKEKSNV